MANEPYFLNTWDPGLNGQPIGIGLDEIRISGTRLNPGDWGAQDVNYMAGASLARLLPSTGSLGFDLLAEGPTGSYGSGSGYKSFVQFWNDPQNYIAVGLISDPGLTQAGKYTVMVEGASNGLPIGGYWGVDKPSPAGGAHHFNLSWQNNELSVVMDDLTQHAMTYGLALTNPSVSFLGAARLPGDGVNARFDNITFDHIGLEAFSVPATLTPRAFIEADVTYSGSGIGHAAYLNLHDAFGNAIAFGFQADVNSRDSDGLPTLHYNQTSNGQFASHRYYDLSLDKGTHHWRLDYYENAIGDRDFGVFTLDNTPVGYTEVTLTDRIFFQPEVNAAANGDSVATTFQNVHIGGTWASGQAVAPNGQWNSEDFEFWGLNAQQGNTQVQGADFTLGGTVSALPDGYDWDTIETIFPGQPVAAIAMITEWWFGA